jgi:hypothetical protein
VINFSYKPGPPGWVENDGAKPLPIFSSIGDRTEAKNNFQERSGKPQVYSGNCVISTRGTYTR